MEPLCFHPFIFWILHVKPDLPAALAKDLRGHEGRGRGTVGLDLRRGQLSITAPFIIPATSEESSSVVFNSISAPTRSRSSIIQTRFLKLQERPLG